MFQDEISYQIFSLFYLEKMTQTEIAKTLNCTKAYVSAILKGRCKKYLKEKWELSEEFKKIDPEDFKKKFRPQKEYDYYKIEFNSQDIQAPYFVYKLFDLRNILEIRYVGFANDLLKRKQAHRQFAIDKPKTPVQFWIRKLHLEGRDFGMEILVTCNSKNEAGQCERELIEKYKNEGHRLLNLAPGGAGGALTGEALESMIKKQKEHFQDPIYKENMLEIWQKKGTEKLKTLHAKDFWAKERAEKISAGIDNEQRVDAAKKIMEDPEKREHLRKYWDGIKPKTGVVTSEGLEFETIRSAAKHYNISTGRVRYAMATGRKIEFSDKIITFAGKEPYTAKV
jgi:transcriptional regulator with XRE-family HTH domain